MPAMTVGTGRALIRGHYHEKVLAMQPIAYWPLWEASGTVAKCLVNTAQNGTYSSDVSTWPVGAGIGDGNTAPQFDGANDYINVFSAAFSAVFPGAVGSFAGWVRVANVGVWTDGTRRDSTILFDDANNYIILRRAVANNTYQYLYQAGGVLGIRSAAGLANTGWVHVAMTWSDGTSANEMKCYWNAVQQGATVGALGNWAGGGLDPNQTLIGATTMVPANVWSGGQAHFSLFNRVLSLPEIQALSTV